MKVIKLALCGKEHEGTCPRCQEIIQHRHSPEPVLERGFCTRRGWARMGELSKLLSSCWQPDIVEGDDRRVFSPNYVVRGEAVPSTKFFRSKFGDLPTFGMWADRSESDIRVWGEGNGVTM